jgi:hypothetical protein
MLSAQQKPYKLHGLGAGHGGGGGGGKGLSLSSHSITLRVGYTVFTVFQIFYADIIFSSFFHRLQYYDTFAG